VRRRVSPRAKYSSITIAVVSLLFNPTKQFIRNTFAPNPTRMEDTLLKGTLLTATGLTGLLCGASLDQSIKQLPARRVIGVTAFSAYAKAADLKNGVIWYAVLGVSAALASIVTAVLAWRGNITQSVAIPLYLGGAFAICHTICTTQAAPTYHSQKKINDEQQLKKLFNKFETIQTFRSGFILLNFLCYIWALCLVV
jgi:hypothetical protein